MKIKIALKKSFNQQTIKLSGHSAVAFMRSTIAIYPIYSILLCLSCKFSDVENIASDKRCRENKKDGLIKNSDYSAKFLISITET